MGLRRARLATQVLLEGLARRRGVAGTLAIAIVGIAMLTASAFGDGGRPQSVAAATHTATPDCSAAQAVTAGNEIKGTHPGVRIFRHPCGGTVLRIASSVAERARAEAAGATKVGVDPPAKADEPIELRRGEDRIAFAPVAATRASGDRVGDTVTYRDAYANAALTYTSTDAGVKETLVLRSAERTRFSSRLELAPGLRAVQRGKSVAIQRGGQAVAWFAAPFMTDASPAHATSDAVTLRLGHAGGRDTLTLSADPAWVREHLQHGPVTIDPTVAFAPADPDCEIQSTAPTANICSATTIGVGVTSVNGVLRKRRALLRYTIARWLPQGSQIYEADLFANITSKPAAPVSVDVVSPTKPWSYGVTWNTYDGTNAWTTPGGDYGATPVATNPSVGDTVGVWERWDVTSAVQGWASTSGQNNGGFGLLLKQSNETTAGGDVTFASSENGAIQGDTLQIYYNNMSGVLPHYRFEATRRLTDHLSMAVNVASGNLLLRSRDLQVHGTGLDLAVDRYYNSREPVTNELGWGWSFGFDKTVRLWTLANGNIQFTGPSDYSGLFVRQLDGSYVKPSGIEGRLVKNADGTYTLTWNQTDERWSFNSSGLLTAQVDRNGNRIAATYTSGDVLTTLADTQGRAATFGYTSGRVTSVTDSAARVQRYAYNTTGTGEGSPNLLMTSSTDANGDVTSYGYTGSALTSITDPRSNTTSFTYDSNRRVTDVAWAGGGHTTFAYGTATATCGNDLSTVVTDPLGHATTYCWEVPGRVTKIVDAAGNVQSATFTSDSQLKTFTDAASKTTTLGYDSLDNQTSASTPTGQSLTWSYGDAAHPYLSTKATNARGTATVASYDSAGNMTSQADGGSPATSTTKAEYTGQATGVCPNPAGPNGTLRCSIDANGNRTTYSYDAKGNLTRITPPVPLAPTAITVDGLSRTSTVTDGKGQKRTYTYDDVDRVTRIDFANSSGVTVSSTTFDYDGNGNLVARADIAGATTKTTSYQYDARNRKTKETFPDTSTNQYTYDGADNLASFTDAGGTVTYAYDNLDQPKSLAEPGGSCSGTVSKCTTFTFDTRGRHRTTTYPNGITQTWTWSDDGQLIDLVAKNAAGTVLRQFTYSYTDPATNKGTGLRFSVTDLAGNKTTYGYDGLDRMTSATTRTANGTGAITDDYHYSYDPTGNVTRQTAMANGGATATTSSIYNAANELCWSVPGSLPAGATCSSAPAGASVYGYDANGNETQRVDSSGSLSMTYNVQDQLTSIAVPGAGTTTYGYLGVGQGERISAGSITFGNSQLGLSSRNASGSASYYTRMSDGTPLGARPSGGAAYYYLVDGLGSIVALTDGAGAVTRSYKYDPYGNTVSNTGSGPTDSLRYAGGYIGTANYYHFGARNYDPASGRWTQQDPIDQAGDLREGNRYAYAGGDPINATDPSGCGAFACVKHCGYTHCGHAGKVTQCMANSHGDAKSFARCLLQFCDSWKFVKCLAGCGVDAVRGLPTIISSLF